MGFNQIGNIGAKYISDVLKINLTIYKIDLSFNHMDSTGAKYISDALEINPTIIYIYLNKSRYDDIICQICKRNKHNGYQKNITLRSLCYAAELVDDQPIDDY